MKKWIMGIETISESNVDELKERIEGLGYVPEVLVFVESEKAFVRVPR